MTEELAMQNLNCLYPHISEEHKQAIDKAIKALEKQIPKKPFHDDSVGVPNGCNSCGNLLLPEDNFCPYCGQAIDWGTINDKN